jgi:hypothetical protein
LPEGEGLLARPYCFRNQSGFKPLRAAKSAVPLWRARDT